MPCNSFSYSACGIKIPANKIVKPYKRALFTHAYTEDMNFCPITGKTLWIDDVKFINDVHVSNIKFDGLEVKLAYCPKHSERFEFKNLNEQVALVGYLKDGDEFWTIDQIVESKKEIEKILSKYDIWNPDTFGVHAYLSENYEY